MIQAQAKQIHSSDKSIPMLQRRDDEMRPTFDDATVMLKLYEMFDSERLRTARNWILHELSSTSYAEFVTHYPPTSTLYKPKSPLVHRHADFGV